MEHNNQPQSQLDEKLPLRALNGDKCLTKCYPKEHPYLHPIILTKIRAPNKNSCAIDPKVGTEYYYDYGICRLEDNLTYKIPSEKESILLNFYFNPHEFLADIYDLHSFSEVINWTIENSLSHFETIKRVHNAAWKAYGSKLENISEMVIRFYYGIAKNNWMKDYLDLIEKKYSFDILAISKTTRVDSIFKAHDIIISNFFSEDFFAQIIKKYVDTFKDKWIQIESHYGNLKKFTYKCLIKNIQYKSNDPNITLNDIDLFSIKIQNV